MTDLRAQLQEGLGDSYALERELGLALACAGRRDEAVSEGKRGVALLSPGWLRIDPEFAPLRGNPRFRKLMEGTT